MRASEFMCLSCDRLGNSGLSVAHITIEDLTLEIEPPVSIRIEKQAPSPDSIEIGFAALCAVQVYRT